MYFLMGKLDESIANYKEVLEIKPDFGSDIKIAYMYALMENYGEATRWGEKYSPGKGQLRHDFEAYLSRCFLAYWLGSNSEAMRRISAASMIFEKAGNPYYQAGFEHLKALIYADRGQFEAGRNALAMANKLSNVGYPQYSEFFDGVFRLGGARFHLRENHAQLVEKVLAETLPALKQLPDFTMWLSLQRHQLKGDLLMVQLKVDEAITHLKGSPDLPTMAPSGPAGYTVYYNATFFRDGLARAYTTKGDLDNAIAEYERITRFDPASNDRRLIHPLHHYQLAKLYEKKGMKEKAIAEYEKFLSIWKNADADRVEPKDARTRVAKLKATGKK